jgi:hypothetical protein
MIWAMLYFYFFGSSNQGLVKDLSKPVKKLVLDDAKAREIIDINQGMLKADKALAQDLEKAQKQLADLNRNRLVPESEFAKIHVALDQQRTAVREKLVEDRFRMKSLMTAEQWASVHGATRAKP